MTIFTAQEVSDIFLFIKSLSPEEININPETQAGLRIKAALDKARAHCYRELANDGTFNIICPDWRILGLLG